MILVNTLEIQGYKITQNLGLVSGNTVQSKHLGRDFMASLKTIVGGEISGYTEMLVDARQQAQDRMTSEAESLGANAVLNVRFTTSAISEGMSELLAYGTAVKIEQI